MIIIIIIIILNEKKLNCIANDLESNRNRIPHT